MDQIQDLHIYLWPKCLWKIYERTGLVEFIPGLISLGFIRVHYKFSLEKMRASISQQLAPDFPENYQFLKQVGRKVAIVRPRQEGGITARDFLPPATTSPDLFIVETDTIGICSSYLNSSRYGVSAEKTSLLNQESVYQRKLDKMPPITTNQRIQSDEIPKHNPDQKVLHHLTNKPVPKRNLALENVNDQQFDLDGKINPKETDYFSENILSFSDVSSTSRLSSRKSSIRNKQKNRSLGKKRKSCQETAKRINNSAENNAKQKSPQNRDSLHVSDKRNLSKMHEEEYVGQKDKVPTVDYSDKLKRQDHTYPIINFPLDREFDTLNVTDYSSSKDASDENSPHVRSPYQQTQIVINSPDINSQLSNEGHFDRKESRRRASYNSQGSPLIRKKLSREEKMQIHHQLEQIKQLEEEMDKAENDLMEPSDKLILSDSNSCRSSCRRDIGRSDREMEQILRSLQMGVRREENERNYLARQLESLENELNSRNNDWKFKYMTEKKLTAEFKAEIKKLEQILESIYRQKMRHIPSGESTVHKNKIMKPSNTSNMLMMKTRLDQEIDKLRRDEELLKTKLFVEMKIKNQEKEKVDKSRNILQKYRHETTDHRNRYLKILVSSKTGKEVDFVFPKINNLK